MSESLINKWDQVQSPGRNELVFANRFKEYGAYQIRSQFSKNQSLATLIALSITALFAAMPIIAEHFFPKEKEENTHLKVTNIDQLKAPEEEEEKEPEKPKIEEPEPQVASDQYVVPKINPDAATEDVIIPPDEIKVVGKKTQDGDEEFDAPDFNDDGGAASGTGDQIATNVQVKASFVGGDAGFRAYVEGEFQYPPRCLEEGINGSVVLLFVVDEAGRISRVKAIEETKSCPEFTTEAIRVLKRSPRWIPGQNNGNFLKSWREMPIRLTVGD
jgi:protein TonB